VNENANEMGSANENVNEMGSENENENESGSVNVAFTLQENNFIFITTEKIKA
jgi:hypothetical protein